MLSVIFDTNFLADTEIKNKSFSIFNYREELSVDIYTIFLGFVDFMRDKYNQKHYSEKIHMFYSECYIELSGNIPKIHWLEDGTFCFASVVIINNKIVCNDYSIKNKNAEISKIRSGNKRAVFRNFNWTSLYQSCELFRDFYHGIELTYNQLIHIARNVCGAEKGKKFFLEILSSNYSYQTNWKEILNAIIKGNIPLQSCENCVYEKECCHSKNMLETAVPKGNDVKVLTKQQYVSIQEASENLNEIFNEVMDSEHEGIYIIKAQTGLGKTNMLINYLKNTDKHCVIAVPTHELKDEIYNKAVMNGINNICCTPALPEESLSDEIFAEINHLYNIGAGKQVIVFLEMLCKRIDKSNKNYKMIKDYLIKSKESLRFKGHIITTHAKLLMVPENTFEDYQIIIDEDILRQVINTVAVPVKDIRAVLNEHKCFTGKAYEKLYKIIHSSGYQFHNEKIVCETKLIKSIDSNIYGLLNSQITYSDSQNVIFVDRKNLPNGKIVIMSATVEHEIYKYFFPMKNIVYYKCKKAEYTGQVIQYIDSSYSRAYFNDKKEAIHIIKNFIEEKPVITFKEFEHIFGSKYHFGNIEGLNVLEGKDLAVIGLPNVTEQVYILYGMCAGINPNKIKMRPQRIEHNGYSFRLNTFDNEIIKKIQLWLLSSQLEQAVGRARVLRYNCSVIVFSGFPVEQAVLKNKLN